MISSRLDPADVLTALDEGAGGVDTLRKAVLIEDGFFSLLIDFRDLTSCANAIGVKEVDDLLVVRFRGNGEPPTPKTRSSGS